MVVLFLAAGSSGLAQKINPSLAGYLPSESGLLEWEQSYEPEHYQPDNLFQYINGEAEHYKDYGVRNVVTAPYHHVEDSLLSFTVDIYDMGTPLNSFGVYSSFRRPDLHFADIGTEATATGTSVRFYQNRFYVQVQAGGLDTRLEEGIRDAARNIADRFPTGDPPDELEWLPRESMVPHSITYKTTGFLGLQVFHDVLRATYVFPEDTVSGFISWFDSSRKATEALASLEQSLKDRGTVIDSPAAGNAHTLRGKAPYQGHILASRESNFVFGCIDYEFQSAADNLVDRLRSRVNR